MLPSKKTTLLVFTSSVLGVMAKRSFASASLGSKSQVQSSMMAFVTSKNGNTATSAKKSKICSAALFNGDTSTLVSSDKSTTMKIFCDLDGVLCDFDAGVRNLFKGSKGSSDFKDKKQGLMWASISKNTGFYEHLPWTEDGKELWEAIVSLTPDILTGVSRQQQSRADKAAWCRRELGVPINHVDMAASSRRHALVNGKGRKLNATNVITCWSSNKHVESFPGAILIDDNDNLAAEWTAAGGTFIHHVNTKSTLRQLKALGLLGNDNTAAKKKAAEKDPFYYERPDTP